MGFSLRIPRKILYIFYNVDIVGIGVDPPKGNLPLFGSERSLRGADVVGGWVCGSVSIML